eukprot:7480861-Karenia_brevis.AAC.1
MAALKLITSSDRQPLRTSSDIGATDGHCQPILHDDMAALKLITSSDGQPLHISSDSGATASPCPHVLISLDSTTRAHVPPFSHAEMASVR